MNLGAFVLVCVLLVLDSAFGSSIAPLHIVEYSSSHSYNEDLSLVPAPTIELSYHMGPLLTSPPERSPLNFHFLWVGTFSPAQKQILVDFASSFETIINTHNNTHNNNNEEAPIPSVSSWWSTATLYTDRTNAHVSSSLSFSSQSSIQLPLGTTPHHSNTLLTKDHLLALLTSSLSSRALPVDPSGLYFIFTDPSLAVEDFCVSECGFHDFTPASPATGNRKLPYAWVGNPSTQCPGVCAWPFAAPQYGPQGFVALRPPNADVGMDGMVINMATLLAGMATNPFHTGYFEGEAGLPSEAVSVCTGIFGQGAYPGNPGSLLKQQDTGASFNALGVNGRHYLLPAIWSPSTNTCLPPST